MQHLAGEQPGDGLETDVGVRADVDALLLGDCDRSHVVDEAPRTDGSAGRRGNARRTVSEPTTASWLSVISTQAGDGAAPVGSAGASSVVTGPLMGRVCPPPPGFRRTRTRSSIERMTDVEIPRIISVDDHVVEPPTLWTDRLPAKYADRAPRVVRDKARFHFEGGVFSYERGVEDGEWCDWWLYDDLVYPFPKLSAAIGFDDLDVTPTTFDEIRPGCWIQADRLADMTANHVDASICFPNTLPRFCGQAFYERADKELALLCVQAYNDWMLDEWSAARARAACSR